MIDKEKISDRDLDNYLHGKDELSAVYAEGDELTVPEHLEFQVRCMARDADTLQATKKKTIWFIPLSIAAAVVLVVIVVFSFNSTLNDHSMIAQQNRDTAPDQLEIVRPETSPRENIIHTEPSNDLKPADTEKKVTASDTQVASAAEPVSNKKIESVLSDAKKTTGLTTKQDSKQVAKQEQEFDLPPHLREIIQTTNAGSSNAILPDEVLATWTRQQWREQVRQLQKASKFELAEKYTKRYPDFFSGETLQIDP